MNQLSLNVIDCLIIGNMCIDVKIKVLINSLGIILSVITTFCFFLLNVHYSATPN